ncbi:LysE family translocator [Aquitalea magnusonii]|uniref:Threonine/homoserine/homoserine lactone efflux protein n=2 Tax=Aquitalea magnusonii TaxID=332411 RepID=A0A318IVD9_9NEIS|nr:LysE family translocator [Aquitalea magnusonii]PXX40146.1 threonine/homoserine/homoserine lactone efflux protein [Aquitalea magnusonii]
MNLVALVTYLLVMSITPGPNNLVLASSGVNYGFGRTLPAMLGMALGLALQVGVLTVFLGNLVALISSVQLYLALAGCSYLLWLSWGMARAGAAGEQADAGQPMGFAGGLLFNWLNPKVWLMGFNIAVVFLPQHMPPLTAGLLFAAITLVVGLPCIALWAGSGVAIRRWLASPRRLRAFNCGMAAMLAGTAFWLLAQMLPADVLPAVGGLI